jgi:hypothetical protein
VSATTAPTPGTVSTARTCSPTWCHTAQWKRTHRCTSGSLSRAPKRRDAKRTGIPSAVSLVGIPELPQPAAPRQSAARRAGPSGGVGRTCCFLRLRIALWVVRRRAHGLLAGDSRQSGRCHRAPQVPGQRRCRPCRTLGQQDRRAAVGGGPRTRSARGVVLRAGPRLLIARGSLSEVPGAGKNAGTGGAHQRAGCCPLSTAVLLDAVVAASPVLASALMGSGPLVLA